MNINNFSKEPVIPEVNLQDNTDIMSLRSEIAYLEICLREKQQENADLKRLIKEFKPTVILEKEQIDFCQVVYKATHKTINDKLYQSHIKCPADVSLSAKEVLDQLLKKLGYYILKDSNIIDLI